MQLERARIAEPVIYQIYVRSFADANGDGMGDLEGVRQRLWHPLRLGADALWLTPFFCSPQRDAGYDVSDYRHVDPLFGTDADADRLFDDAHRAGLSVVVDLVPNHTSSDHPWFAALQAGDESMAARYHLLPGRGPDGAVPPNGWESMFGGPAWTRLPDGRWYLHLFDSSQPDLNWANPTVRAEFLDVMGGWLDRGADGFRVDVAAGLIKADGYPDVVEDQPHPYWNRPQVHEIYREWAQLWAQRDRPVFTMAETWGEPDEVMKFARRDEYDSVFAFRWMRTEFQADALQTEAAAWLAAAQDVGALPTWVLGSHDFVRPVTRYGGGLTGLRRARALALVAAAQPGAVCVHQGEELGLPEVDVPPALRQDPEFLRTGGAKPGRDGVRVPLPWSGAEPPYGFTLPDAPAGGAGPGPRQPWLPQPNEWADLSVARQWQDTRSTLRLYTDAFALRRRLLLPAGPQVRWLDVAHSVMAFERGPVTCWLNTGVEPVALPSGATVLIRSDHDVSASQSRSGILNPDCAAWFVGSEL
ncbi:MAG: alpha-amylase family glycosyl hydrolase [Actinomycetes bacterium]